MNCRTPEVDVPEAFDGWDIGLQPADNRRRRSVDSFAHSLPKKEAILHDENHLTQRYPRSVQQ